MKENRTRQNDNRRSTRAISYSILREPFLHVAEPTTQKDPKPLSTQQTQAAQQPTSPTRSSKLD